MKNEVRNPVVSLMYLVPGGLRYSLIELPGGLFVVGHSRCCAVLRRFYATGEMPKLGHNVFQSSAGYVAMAASLVGQGRALSTNVEQPASSYWFTIAIVYMSLFGFWVGVLWGPKYGFCWENVGFEYFMVYLSWWAVYLQKYIFAVDTGTNIYYVWRGRTSLLSSTTFWNTRASIGLTRRYYSSNAASTEDVILKLQTLHDLGLFPDVNTALGGLLQNAVDLGANKFGHADFLSLSHFFRNKEHLGTVLPAALREAAVGLIGSVWAKSVFNPEGTHYIPDDSGDLTFLFRRVNTLEQALNNAVRGQEESAAKIDRILKGQIALQKAVFDLKTQIDSKYGLGSFEEDVAPEGSTSEGAEGAATSNASPNPGISNFVDFEEYASPYGAWEFKGGVGLVWVGLPGMEANWYLGLTIPDITEAPTTEQLLEWTLLMDAFISSTVVQRPKAFGLFWNSPHLTVEVSTEKLIILSWHWVLNSPDFLALKERAAAANRTTFSALISILNGDHWISISNSLFFTPGVTTFEEWRKHFLSGLSALKDRPYSSESLVKFEIKVYAVAPPAKFSIGPVKKATALNFNTTSLDIETLTLKDNTLLPYAIGFYYNTPRGRPQYHLYYLTAFLRGALTPENEDELYREASDRMLMKALSDLHKLRPKTTVYVHNLGGFDSTFLLKPLAALFGEYKLLLDASNKVISITLDNKLVFKDSYRIFAASLKELSTIFNVTTPKGEFDHTKVCFNNLSTIRSELEEYLKKDLRSLFDVMHAAAEMIFNLYHVDLSNVYSTSSLAMKIYRTNYLNTNIPLLPTWLEREIRSSYKGGSVQVFKHEGHNLYYYDINSLYPYTMTGGMPLHYLDRLNGSDIHLSSFSGFVYAKVHLQEGHTPTIPHHLQKGARLTYPRVPFEGLFYSAELYDAQQNGYVVNIKYGYLFSSQNLFTEYVEHMYNKKLEATDQPELRFIYKLLLNGLYGYFGRRLFNPETRIVNDDTLSNIVSKYNISFVVELNENLSIVVYDPSWNRETGTTEPLRPANANVAIASAITSLGRCVINPFKRDSSNPIFYSDTDSIFVQNPIHSALIGDNLGQWKNELTKHGGLITNAIFVRPKVYGFETVTGYSRVVVAGFPRDQLTLAHLKTVLNGGAIRDTRPQLIRDFKHLKQVQGTMTRTLYLHDDD